MPSSPRSASPSERWLRTLALSIALAPFAAVVAAGDIAVVVHPSVKIDELSLVDLRKVLRGYRQYWSPGQPVTLIVRSPGAAERTVLLDKIYQMSEAEFRRYWVAKVFRAEATTAPKVVISNQKAVELVGVMPGAIALVAAEDVPEGLKVLKIGGAKPGEKTYPLK
jgi:hypothetical protein